MTDPIHPLADHVEALRAADRAFARDLLASVEKRGTPTPRQAEWLDKLLARATGAEPGGASGPDILLTGIVAMFDRSTLRSPRLTLQDAKGNPVQLSRPSSGRYPGAIHISEDGYGSVYYGRIDADGTLQPRREMTPGVRVLLADIEANPAETLRAIGRATGTCCCCGRELTDPESVAAGIGPVCATRWA